MSAATWAFGGIIYIKVGSILCSCGRVGFTSCSDTPIASLCKECRSCDFVTLTSSKFIICCTESEGGTFILTIFSVVQPSFVINFECTLFNVCIAICTILLHVQCGHPLELIGVQKLLCGDFSLIWSCHCNFISYSLSFLDLHREEVDGEHSLIGTKSVSKHVFIGVVRSCGI